MVITFCDTCMHIQLGMCDTCLTTQGIVNDIRTYEDCTHFLDDAKIMDACGKADVGGGASTAITITLQNCWQIRGFCGFACQTNVIISQGNIAFICCPSIFLLSL